MSNITNIVADKFESEVLKSKTPVLVDFWATWCGPCQVMGPVLEEVATEIGAKAKIVKVDVDDKTNIALARQYGIRSIPSMKIFKGGEVVAEFLGITPKEDLVKALKDSA